MIHSSPIVFILVILAVLFVFGGNSYNGGAYRSYGFGFGGLLFLLFILFLLGVI